MRKLHLMKALALVVCVLMFTSFVVGCGSSPKEEPASSSTTATAAPESTAASTSNPADLKGSIVFWHFNKDEGPKIVKAFNAKYPNVKVDVQITPDTDLAYQNKIAAALRSGSGMPDVFAAESAFVTRFVNLPDAYDDLSAAPYNAGDITKNMIPYTVQIGTDKNGVLRALSHQACPGAVGYKRDVAKKYLGTDDPAAISEMLSTPDKILETAKKLSEASKGAAKLFPGQDELFQIYKGARSTGWIKDNKLVIDPKMDEYLDLMKKLRDGKYDSGIKAWTPAWNAAIADDKSMCFAIPTWGIPYIIAANDKDHADTGRWGIANGPASYFWGGTWYGVYSKSKNKEAAWAFVKHFVSDKDALKAWAKDTGDFVNNKELINELQNDDSFISKVVNQNPYKIFGPMVDNINGSIFTAQDDVINKAWQDYTDNYLAGQISREDALKKFKEKVKSSVQDITVE